uniref:Uncharacterized protein n=1 Tax=Anguilla anguilla TaxID=7936 RepID=A0A0E9T1T2_ANGAN
MGSFWIRLDAPGVQGI